MPQQFHRRLRRFYHFAGRTFCSVSLLVSVSCTHALHQVHEGDLERIPTGRNFKRVKSRAEQFVVLGFVRQTDYVNKAYRDLAKQCPAHEVEGIQTRYSSSHGFLSWTNKVVMQGYCLE